MRTGTGGLIYNAATGTQVGTFDLPLDNSDPHSNGGKPDLVISGDTLYATSGSGDNIYTFDISQVPEPSGMLLVVAGGAVAVGFGRRRMLVS